MTVLLSQPKFQEKLRDGHKGGDLKRIATQSVPKPNKDTVTRYHCNRVH